MMRLYKGRVFFTISTTYPGWGSGANDKLRKKGFVANYCIKYWKIPFVRLYIAKRMYIKSVSDALLNKVREAAELYYDTKNISVVSGYYTHINVVNLDTGKAVTYYNETYKIFKKLKMPALTEDWQVIYDYDTEKYYGYSHRGCQGFGVGDMLFTEDKLSTNAIIDNFYSNKKYRKRFIDRLKYYSKRNDTYGFYDLVNSGLMSIVPFREKGLKRIESNEEAFQAASNFAKYIS